jgi:hypothetical protein
MMSGDAAVERSLPCAWYDKDAEYKMSPESSPVSRHSKGPTVLKRQSDRSWKAVIGRRSGKGVEQTPRRSRYANRHTGLMLPIVSRSPRMRTGP